LANGRTSPAPTAAASTSSAAPFNFRSGHGERRSIEQDDQFQSEPRQQEPRQGKRHLQRKSCGHGWTCVPIGQRITATNPVYQDHEAAATLRVGHTTILDALFEKPAKGPVIDEPDNLPPIISGSIKGGDVHQDQFWKTYDLGRFSTFNEFHENFPGLIMDFSEGQLHATFDTLSQQVELHYQHPLQRTDFESMIRFCSVHFKRNLARVARNGRIITNHKEQEFKKEILRLFDSSKLERLISFWNVQLFFYASIRSPVVSCFDMSKCVNNSF
jgi:hypothetical protein